MSVYTRRFLSDPGDSVLLNIESVNILDLTPPANIQGIGTGTVLLVGEFENGPYNTPQQLLGTTDLARTWGTLGYQYGGLAAQNPSAPVRHADGAIAPEFWNGNAFVQISGQTYATLIFVRVNTSVGSVTFESCAYIEGAVEFAYILQSGEVLDLAVSDFATTTTATTTLPQATIAVASTTGFPSSGSITLGGQTVAYTGVSATTFTGCTGGAGPFPAGTIVVGGAPTAATFTGVAASYETPATTVAVGSNGTNMPSAGVIDAVTTGFPTSGAASVAGTSFTYTGTTGTSFTGCTRSSGAAALTTGESVTAGAYPTGFSGGQTITLAFDNNANFTVAFQAGDQTLAQVVSRINSFAGFAMASGASGQLTLVGRTAGTGGSVQVVGDNASGAVLGQLGLVAGTTYGTGNVANIAQVQFAEIQTIVQNAVSGTTVQLNSSGAIRISNTGNPGQGGIEVGAGTTALNLGFVSGQANLADTDAGGVIPAGTVVQNSAGTCVLVTTQDLTVSPNAPGPYTVPVRFANDNGTGTGVGSGQVTVVPNPPNIGAFAVTNTLPIANAMTESQLDAAYAAAIATTTDVNSVARVANIIVSARQSNTVRSQLRANALYASANGCYGRMACVSPPLNTSPQVALSQVAAPGVGATSDQRVIYCYVGNNTFVPLIGQVGLAGGVGFTATGNVDVHSDTLMASILSQLNPEENPGQLTTFTANVNGIETGANVQGFDINDYIAFKAAGIAALRMDNGVAIFQSGVTSVNPQVFPQLTRISRRRMADFIQDSIAIAAKAFGKKLSVQARRKALKGEIRSFLAGLLSKNNPGSQRIGGYTVDDSDGNTDVTLSEGMYRITVNVKTLASLDSIVVQTTIGEDVDVTEVLPQAA